MLGFFSLLHYFPCPLPCYIDRCIYTGTVDIQPEEAHELLRAADQYLLDGLKRLCEHAMVQVRGYFKVPKATMEHVRRGGGGGGRGWEGRRFHDSLFPSSFEG